MTDNKTTLHFYFHPIIVPTLSLLPIVMIISFGNVLKDVSTFKGYMLTSIIVIFIIFLIIRIVRYLFQLVKGQPALTLTAKNLIEYQTGLTIDWIDIKDFSIGGYRTTAISIKLFDREKYISFFKNPVTKFMYRLNSRLFHGTFTFNVSILKGDNGKILETLENYLLAAKELPNADQKAST